MRNGRDVLQRIAVFAVFALGLLVHPATGEAQPSPAAPIKVVTTTGMIADAATNVGGSRVVVESLMGTGVDPHLYKATQGDLSRLQSADIIFFNGLHLEGKMVEIFTQIAKRRPCFAVTDSIERTKLRSPPEFQGNFDPHVWFDVSLWVDAAREIGKRLRELDPASAAQFQSSEDAYVARLTELDGWVKEQLKTLPPERRVLITAHDAFGYFGRAYGLEVVGLQGISTAAEFGLNDMTRLVNLVVDRNVPAIFVESSVPRRFIEALQEGVRARGKDVTIGGELFSDSMGEAGTEKGTYVGMVRHNVSTIVGALALRGTRVEADPSLEKG